MASGRPYTVFIHSIYSPELVNIPVRLNDRNMINVQKLLNNCVSVRACECLFMYVCVRVFVCVCAPACLPARARVSSSLENELGFEKLELPRSSVVFLTLQQVV